MELTEIARWIAGHSLEAFGGFVLLVGIVAYAWWRYKA